MGGTIPLVRRLLILLAIATATSGAAVGACASFSGSDAQVDTTKDGAVSGDGGANGNATDGGVEGGLVLPPNDASVLSCANVDAGLLIFCNDFNATASDTAYTSAGVGNDGLGSDPFVSPPTALNVTSSATRYVLFTATKVHANWRLSFWVYLDSSVPLGTEIAYVQPTSTQLTFVRSAIGIKVQGVDLAAATGWVKITVQPSAIASNITVMLLPQQVGTTVPMANTEPLRLGLGVIGTGSPGSVWFDDVLATSP